MRHISALTKHLTFQFIMEDASKSHVSFIYLSFKGPHTRTVLPSVLTARLITA
jgi:hypothetical protein